MGDNSVIFPHTKFPYSDSAFISITKHLCALQVLQRKTELTEILHLEV